MPSFVEAFVCFASAQTETFRNHEYPTTAGGLIPGVVVVVIAYFLLMLFGQYLWNNVLCSLVSFARPAKSIFEIIGLAILIQLLRP
jgi:small-conductance mechanosensitive channel